MLQIPKKNITKISEKWPRITEYIHPDIAPENIDKFNSLQTAYSIISNEDKRAIYNSVGTKGLIHWTNFIAFKLESFTIFRFKLLSLLQIFILLFFTISSIFTTLSIRFPDNYDIYSKMSFLFVVISSLLICTSIILLFVFDNQKFKNISFFSYIKCFLLCSFSILISMSYSSFVLTGDAMKNIRFISFISLPFVIFCSINIAVIPNSFLKIMRRPTNNNAIDVIRKEFRLMYTLYVLCVINALGFLTLFIEEWLILLNSVNVPKNKIIILFLGISYFVFQIIAEIIKFSSIKHMTTATKEFEMHRMVFWGMQLFSIAFFSWYFNDTDSSDLKLFSFHNLFYPYCISLSIYTLYFIYHFIIILMQPIKN